MKRKDNQCEVQILASNRTSVLVRAFWPATLNDSRNGRVPRGSAFAQNITWLPLAYFEKKYGALA